MPENGDAPQLESPLARGPWWRWWPWAVVLAAAALGLAVGVVLGMRNSSLFSEEPSGTSARPTIVVGARPSPSPVAVAPSVVSSPSPTRPQQEEEYVVQSGDTLRSIAQRVYGNPELWTRLYEYNRGVIGPDANALQPGMRLRIPAG